MSTIKLTKEQESQIFAPATKQGDQLVLIAFIGLFAIGVILSFWYDTFDIAIGVGGLNIAAYFIAKSIFKGTKFYQYVAGVIFPIFMAQFIYQMHGLFEMHFFAFFGSVVMIGYQNWKLQLPLLLTIVVHHSTFAYLQYSGVGDIYYTQMDYMDLETFIFHAAIAAIIISICAFWGFDLSKKTIKAGLDNIQLSSQMEIVKANKIFAEEIAEGNLDVEFELEEAKEDELGKALMRMKTSLQEAAVNEQKERFTTNGINKLGELFQQFSSQPDEFYTRCINFLTDYMQVVQGAIYVVDANEEDPTLHRKATYAYDRNKFMEETVKPGEGLVGQCYLEMKKIYMTNIPQNYLRITSGLGDAEPGCVIIFPLMSNDKIMGVIELAGFHKLTDDKMVFVDRVGETLAASINTLRTAESTKYLLTVSQDQQEQMRQQEEEMRQNLEEMNATQEEMHSKEMQRDAQMKAIGAATAYIEFTPDGHIITANKLFQTAMQYSLNDLAGKHHRIFCDSDYANSIEYKSFWDKLGKGEPFSGEVKRFKKSGEEVWLNASYTAVKDDYGKVLKVIKLAADITARKNMAEENKAKMDAINSTAAYIEFTPQGKILTANNLFVQALGYSSLDEIVGQHHRMFCDKEYIKTAEYAKFWEDLSQGLSKSGEYERFSKSGDSVWISASYTAVKNDSGEVVKVIKIAQDITAQKQHDLDIEGQLAAIGKSFAVIEFDLKGNILKANDFFCINMGYSEDEIVGKHHGMFVEEKYRESDDYKYFWESLGEGNPNSGTFERYTKDGTKVQLQATYSPIYNSENQAYKVVKYAMVV